MNNEDIIREICQNSKLLEARIAIRKITKMAFQEKITQIKKGNKNCQPIIGEIKKLIIILQKEEVYLGEKEPEKIYSEIIQPAYFQMIRN